MIKPQPQLSLLLLLMLTFLCRAGCVAPTDPPKLLDFWATNCGPCRPALALIQSLHTRYPRLRVLGVAMDGPGTVADVGPLLRRCGVTYPVRIDPAANLRLAQAYGVRVYPTLFLLDGHGHAVWSHAGSLDAHAYASLCGKVASMLPVPLPRTGQVADD